LACLSLRTGHFIVSEVPVSPSTFSLRIGPLAFLVTGFLVPGGCALDDRPPSVAVTARDSAGVTILEHAALDSTTAPWVLGNEPLYRVGAAGSGRIFERIADAAILADGRVVVADIGGTQELVVLGRDGSLEHVLGGRGEGPGEFTDLNHVAAGPGGRVLAQESWGAITVFEADSVVHTRSARAPDQVMLLGGDDRRIFLGPPFGMVIGRLYPEAWRRVPLVVLDVATERADTVGEVDWDQSLNFHGRDPFAASGFAVWVGERFVVGRGDVPELRWLDSTGRVQRIVRWSDPPAPADSVYGAYEDYRREQYRTRGMDNARIEGTLERPRQQHQGTLPYFDGMFAGPGGSVLLDGFVRTGYAEPPVAGRRMFVFGADGRSRGVIRLPTEGGFTPLAFSDDRVVGRAVDDLGTPLLVVYSIRPAGQGG
jgi:hypothetical protein